MRPLLFAEDGAMGSLMERLEADGLRPLPRNPRYFKPSEVEPAPNVFIQEGALNAAEIEDVYSAREVDVVVIPADPASPETVPGAPQEALPASHEQKRRGRPRKG